MISLEGLLSRSQLLLQKPKHQQSERPSASPIRTEAVHHIRRQSLGLGGDNKNDEQQDLDANEMVNSGQEKLFELEGSESDDASSPVFPQAHRQKPAAPSPIRQLDDSFISEKDGGKASSDGSNSASDRPGRQEQAAHRRQTPARKDNVVADKLSRSKQTDHDYQLTTCQFERLAAEHGPYTVDLFGVCLPKTRPAGHRMERTSVPIEGRKHICLPPLSSSPEASQQTPPAEQLPDHDCSSRLASSQMVASSSTSSSHRDDDFGRSESVHDQEIRDRASNYINAVGELTAVRASTSTPRRRSFAEFNTVLNTLLARSLYLIGATRLSELNTSRRVLPVVRDISTSFFFFRSPVFCFMSPST